MNMSSEHQTSIPHTPSVILPNPSVRFSPLLRPQRCCYLFRFVTWTAGPVFVAWTAGRESEGWTSPSASSACPAGRASASWTFWAPSATTTTVASGSVAWTAGPASAVRTTPPASAEGTAGWVSAVQRPVSPSSPAALRLWPAEPRCRLTRSASHPLLALHRLVAAYMGTLRSLESNESEGRISLVDQNSSD